MDSNERTRSLIFSLLKSSGESQQQLADLLDVGFSLISQWKTGKSNSFRSKEYIGKIADHFGVTTDYLIGNSETPYSEYDPEIVDCFQEIRNRPELLELFSTIKNCKKADIEKLIQIVKIFK